MTTPTPAHHTLFALSADDLAALLKFVEMPAQQDRYLPCEHFRRLGLLAKAAPGREVANGVQWWKLSKRGRKVLEILEDL